MIVGTGAPSARQATRLTADVVAAGADAVLVLSPPGAVSPVDYYADVVRAADGAVPVLAYHFPQMSSPGIDVELLPRLIDVGVVGIKDSSGDPSRLVRTLDLFDGWLYVGSPWLLSAAGPLGATGAILAVANVEPTLSIAAFAGDVEAQRALAPSNLASGPAAVKRSSPNAPVGPVEYVSPGRPHARTRPAARTRPGQRRRSPHSSQWVTASAGLRRATPNVPAGTPTGTRAAIS